MKIEFYKETNFKQTPIGELPRDWEANKLGSICKFKRGFSYRSNQITNNQTPIRFITINDIEKEGGLKRGAEKIYIKDPSEVNSDFLVDDGDVLIANTDMAKGFIIGAPILIKNLSEKCAYSMDLTKLIFDKTKICGDFLFYYLTHPQMRKKMKSSAQGTNVLHLNHEHISDLLIPLPPILEQRAVAEVLSVVDLAIQRTDMVIAKTERLKKGLMQELLTRGIGHKEFKDTEIGRIPKDWEVVRLKDISEQRKEIVLPEEVNPLTPYIGLEHISSGVTKIKNFGKAGDVKSSKFKFFKNDILYGKLRPYLDKAVIAEVNGVCSTDIIIIKAVKCIPSFLIYLLHTKDFINYATATMTGTNHPRTSWPAISKFNLPLPPTEEQQKIAEILLTVDKKLEIERNEKARLEIIKQGLMDLLLTGKVRVRVN